MSLKARPFDLRFDDTILRVFASLRGEELPEKISSLPPTGVVVLYGNRPICLGFLICCDNGMGIFSDFLSDPTVDKKLRQDAVQMMRSTLTKHAQAKGLAFITSVTKHKKLADRLQTLGFRQLGEGFYQMGRVLWP